MKTCIYILLLTFYYAECRKVYPTIDKNANLAFINMETGGMRANQPGKTGPAQPTVAPVPAQKPVVPPPTQAPTTVKAVPAKPAQPTPAPTQHKPAPTQPNPAQTQPKSAPAQPKPVPNQIKPVPVNPSPAANPITTPGPGSVKQLINFYDSQGKASPIRPYSYSQAVKQG